ncbi:MAG: hypothetical protein ACLQK4_16910 [Acidimicrobiales bacterium]
MVERRPDALVGLEELTVPRPASIGAARSGWRRLGRRVMRDPRLRGGELGMLFRWVPAPVTSQPPTRRGLGRGLLGQRVGMEVRRVPLAVRRNPPTVALGYLAQFNLLVRAGT